MATIDVRYGMVRAARNGAAGKREGAAPKRLWAICRSVRDAATATRVRDAREW